MEQVEKAIRGSSNVEQLIREVINTVFYFFNSDRAWLLYPCDPDAPLFRIPVEVTRPEYPGALELNLEVPITPGSADDMQSALSSDSPIIYMQGINKPVSENTAKQFSVQSQIFMAIYPKTGKPWIFGLHQCSYPRIWKDDEQKLFKSIGNRLTDALTSLLFLEDLRESEEKYRILTETMVDTVFTVDLDGLITYISPQCMKLFGYMPDELNGKSFVDFVPAEEIDMLDKKLKQSGAKGTSEIIRRLDILILNLCRVI